MKTTVSISDSPQGRSENIRTADKLLLQPLSINLEMSEVRLLVNLNLVHYDENRAGQRLGFEITTDTHDLTMKPGDSPRQITVDGTIYKISVLGVSHKLNNGGQYRYAELEISW
jgi:hypothetical protein